MPERNGVSRIQIIRDKFAAMARADEAVADSTLTVERFNERLAVKKTVWAWPTIAAALVSKHHWLVVACDTCGLVLDLDLRVKPRDPEASIRVALPEVRCPRCNGHGRTRMMKLSPYPSI